MQTSSHPDSRVTELAAAKGSHEGDITTYVQKVTTVFTHHLCKYTKQFVIIQISKTFNIWPS